MSSWPACFLSRASKSSKSQAPLSSSNKKSSPSWGRNFWESPMGMNTRLSSRLTTHEIRQTKQFNTHLYNIDFLLIFTLYLQVWTFISFLSEGWLSFIFFAKIHPFLYIRVPNEIIIKSNYFSHCQSCPRRLSLLTPKTTSVKEAPLLFPILTKSLVPLILSKNLPILTKSSLPWTGIIKITFLLLKITPRNHSRPKLSTAKKKFCGQSTACKTQKDRNFLSSSNSMGMKFTSRKA